MEDFKDKKVAIMGGAGFIGSNLAKTLLRLSPREILIVDNLLSSERTNIPSSPKITFVEGSMSEARILQYLRDDLDFIFHLATFHGNQNSISNPLGDHENNTLTTLKLFEQIKNFQQLKKVIYASAGCSVAEKTFGEARATREDDPISLTLDSPYQISKIIGEYYSNYYFNQYRLPVVKARFQNVYGPGEVLGAGDWRGTSATIWRNVIPTFVFRAIKKMPLIVENEGKATRDFIYVDDIIRGLILCATHGVPGEVYNLASGIETSIIELATLINRLTGNPTGIRFAPKRDWDHSGKRFGSTQKARDKMGFEARVTVEEGLMETISWTVENMSLIETCIQKHASFVKE